MHEHEENRGNFFFLQRQVILVALKYGFALDHAHLGGLRKDMACWHMTHPGA